MTFFLDVNVLITLIDPVRYERRGTPWVHPCSDDVYGKKQITLMDFFDCLSYGLWGAGSCHGGCFGVDAIADEGTITAQIFE